MVQEAEAEGGRGQDEEMAPVVEEELGGQALWAEERALPAIEASVPAVTCAFGVTTAGNQILSNSDRMQHQLHSCLVHLLAPCSHWSCTSVTVRSHDREKLLLQGEAEGLQRSQAGLHATTLAVLNLRHISGGSMLQPTHLCYYTESRCHCQQFAVSTENAVKLA